MHIVFWNIYLEYLPFDDYHAKVQKHPEQTALPFRNSNSAIMFLQVIFIMKERVLSLATKINYLN